MGGRPQAICGSRVGTFLSWAPPLKNDLVEKITITEEDIEEDEYDNEYRIQSPIEYNSPQRDYINENITYQKILPSSYCQMPHSLPNR